VKDLGVELVDIDTVFRESDFVTVNTLLTWTQGRGLFLLIVLLCLPFLAPASLPGTMSLSSSGALMGPARPRPLPG